MQQAPWLLLVMRTEGSISFGWIRSLQEDGVSWLLFRTKAGTGYR